MAFARRTGASYSASDTQEGFFDQLYGLGGFGGVPLLTEAEINAMTVGQYRTLLNDAIAALRAFDWSSMQELLDDPDISSHLPADVYALLQEAIAQRGENIVRLLEDGLSLVDGYADSDVLGEIFAEDPDGPDIDFDLHDFPTTAAQLEDHAESYGWQIDAEADSFAFTSPTFRFDDADGGWAVLGDAPEQGAAGSTAGAFLSAVGEVVGDAVVTILGQADGVLGGLIQAGGTASDLAEAWQVGADAGEEFGDVLQYGVDGYFDGTLDVEALDARANSAVRNFVADLVGLIPGAGPTVRNIVFGSRNSDVTLVVGSEAALFNGTAHGDRFLLGAGHDRFDGGAGRDVLFGLAGNDRLLGGRADDALFGGAGRDRLDGGRGSDVLLGGAGRDILSGLSGKDRLLGGADRDALPGGTEQDRLFGGAGNDTLNGGRGDDRLIGGLGRDVFVFGTGFGRDVITDFRNGQDRIDLSGGLRFRDATETAVTGGVRLSFEDQPGLTLTVMGVTRAQLGAEDFF